MSNTKSKHTPGPWIVYEDKILGQLIDTKPESGANLIVRLNFLDDNITKANAALIAAAPEMFEALIACSIHLSLDSNDFHDLEKLIADVLKKARGES